MFEDKDKLPVQQHLENFL